MTMTELNDYTVLHAVPSTEIYRKLRAAAGLSAKTEEAARRGLAGTLFAVQILDAGMPIGMGRVIGDGGSFYQVTDIVVLPEYQGKGLGKQIMREIRRYLDENAPESAYVSLLADSEAHRLYAQFGFKLTAPATVGMAYKVPAKQTQEA
jgi:GNAT superfamily N-acetyltransferase